MWTETLKKVGAPELYPVEINIEKVIKEKNLDELLGAFIRGQDFNLLDSHKNNFLHTAVRTGDRLTCRAVCAFSEDLELWKKKNADGKTPIDIADGCIRLDLNMISTPRSIANTHHLAYNKELIEQKIKDPKSTYKVLLALDGGGLRVVLQASILMQIERELGEPLRNHVHWIGGTSCGGIMASTLGTGIDLVDARKLYILVRKRIFCGNTRMFPKHSAEGIESLLKDLLGAKTMMGSLKAHKMVVTSAKVQTAPPQLVLFRSYAPRLPSKEFEQLGYLNPEKILLWKAIRCTSAAPVYFPSFNGMADGAIFCNNPSIMLITEFLKLKKIENHRNVKNNDEIGCMISIGTGLEPSVPLNGIDINVSNAFDFGGNFREIVANSKNLITLFLYQCTTSHNVHVGQSREWAHSLNVPFFRFTPRLSSSFELDNCNVDILVNSMFENVVYIRTQINDEISSLVRLLKALPKNKKKEKEMNESGFKKVR